MRDQKIHFAGTQHVAPVEGSRGYERVKARGCRVTPPDYFDMYGECAHEYAWTCDECPALRERVENNG